MREMGDCALFGVDGGKIEMIVFRDLLIEY